jgi:hypothetical protein
MGDRRNRCVSVRPSQGIVRVRPEMESIRFWMDADGDKDE